MERQVIINGEQLPNDENIYRRICNNVFHNINSLEVNIVEKQNTKVVNVYINQTQNVVGYGKKKMKRKLDENKIKYDEVDCWKNKE
jgi:hypothetical protein